MSVFFLIWPGITLVIEELISGLDSDNSPKTLPS